MKIRPLPDSDIVSIEKIVAIEAEEDETMGSVELDEGIYALDSLGRIWKKVETASGLIEHFTTHDGVKRQRAKRTSNRT